MQAFQWLVEFEFARNALFTGIIIGTLCSLLSVLVVLKRMAFIGQGLSHAGFGGVGIAVFLGLIGLRQDLVVLLFCMAMAVGIGMLTRRRIASDSAIGIALAAAMALGVFMSDLRRIVQAEPWYIKWLGPPQAPPRVEDLLFGSLYAVSRADMHLALGVAGAILLVLAACFKEILFYSFDEEASRVFGVRTSLIHYMLLAILSLTIVLSMRLALKQAKASRGFGGWSQRVPAAEQRSAVVEPSELSLLHRSMFPFWVGRRGGAGASGLRLQGRLSAT